MPSLRTPECQWGEGEGVTVSTPKSRYTSLYYQDSGRTASFLYLVNVGTLSNEVGKRSQFYILFDIFNAPLNIGFSPPH